MPDTLFNVVAIAGDDGAVKQRFAYQAYGQSLGLDPDFSSYSGLNYDWEYGFTGREVDFVTGLQINRTRYMHLQLGRWLTVDPIGPKSGTVSFVAYANSNPISTLDPSGLINVVPTKHSKYLDERPCTEDQYRFTQWKLELRDPQPTSGGYIVQKVTVDCGFCTSEGGVGESYSYWEAWPIPNPRGLPNIDIAYYQTGNVGTVIGKLVQKGEFRFYTREQVGDEIEATWRTHQTFGTVRECNVNTSEALAVPSVNGEAKEPNFWKTKPARGPVERSFEYHANCSNGVGTIRASASPD